MRRAAIVAPLRTAVGMYGGSLRPVSGGKLIATVIKALIARTGLDPMRIDDVIFAQSYANGEAPCIGRWAALEADLPIEVPGYQLDRRCGGGLQAVLNAAMMVQTGAADVVIAGGVESMSNVEYYTTDMRWGTRAGSVTLHDRLERGRERSQPEWRFGAHLRHDRDGREPGQGIRDSARGRRTPTPCAATSARRRPGRRASFDDEVVPVSVPQPKGDPMVFAQDEGFRADASMETLAKLQADDEGRHRDRRQRQPAERRGGRLPGGRRRQAGGTEARADGLSGRLGRRGLRSGDAWASARCRR